MVEMTTAETHTSMSTVTYSLDQIFTHAWIALPIMDFACGAFNRYYYHDDSDMNQTIISHVYYTEMFGALVQSVSWAAGIFWVDPNAELLFRNSSKAHILFEMFMIWQQFHAHNSSDVYNDDTTGWWPQTSVNIVVAHGFGVPR